MIAQKNLTHLVITNTAAATTALPVTASEFGVRRIGELLCDASALVAGDRFQVVWMGVDGKVRETPIYSWSDLVSKSIVNVASAASQKSHIGYNGTDGDIVATNKGNYLVTLGLRDTLKMTGNKKLYKHGEYLAGTTAKNYDVAIGLADSITTNMSKDGFPRLKVKAICSSAYTSGNGAKSGQEPIVVKGSRYVTFETDLGYAAGGALIVAGDYLRIGTAAWIQGTPAVGSSVYRVIEVVDATTVKLDRPVTEASGTYEDLTTGTQLEVIPKATAEGSTIKWGICVEGNDTDAPFEVGKYGDNLIMFSVGVSADFSTTEVRLTTTPSMGIGTYKGIAALDWELHTRNREKYRIAEYPVVFTPNITSAWTLTHVRTFKFKDRSTESVGSVAESYLTLMIANTTTSDSNLDTIFTQTA